MEEAKDSMELTVGAILEGKVKSITNFGAFIALPENKTGMVHISEVANSYVSDIRAHLTEGQEVIRDALKWPHRQVVVFTARYSISRPMNIRVMPKLRQSIVARLFRRRLMLPSERLAIR